MAKITAALIAGALALGLTSCGSGYEKYFDDNGYFSGVKASESLTLPQYKGISINKSEITVTDAEVEEQLSSLQGDSISYEQVYDRAVVDGDTVNIDYVGSIDGVEFDGGSTGGEGTDVTIGVTSYIDDFLDQLIGHMPGETFDVNVTFPEDYGVDELNGKDAVFVTTINYIRGLPEDLDTLAASYGFASGEELRADIVKFLEENKYATIASTIYLQSTCEKIPSKVTKFLKALEEDSLEQYAVEQGMAVSQYLLENGYSSMGAYLNTLEDSIKQNALSYLAVQAIAELENITVTDEDLTAEGYTEEDFEAYGKNYIKNYVLSQKVNKFIIDNAVIVDDTAVSEEAEDDTAVSEGTDTTAPEGEAAVPEDNDGADATEEQPAESTETAEA